MIFYFWDFITRPSNLTLENGYNIVNIDDSNCKVYSQNKWGIWSLEGTWKRIPVKSK